MTPSLASCARWRDTVLLGCPVAAASTRTEGKQRPVRSAKLTRFCNVQCRCRRTVRYRSRVTGTNESKVCLRGCGATRLEADVQNTRRPWQESGLLRFAVSRKLAVAKQLASGQPDYADPPSEAGLCFMGVSLAGLA